MAQSGTMTVRLDPATRKRLDKLARATARSKSYLAQQAIRDYLELQEWQVAAVEDGVSAADEGRLIDGELVEDWLDSWGRNREKRPPV